MISRDMYWFCSALHHMSHLESACILYHNCHQSNKETYRQGNALIRIRYKQSLINTQIGIISVSQHTRFNSDCLHWLSHPHDLNYTCPKMWRFTADLNVFIRGNFLINSGRSFQRRAPWNFTEFFMIFVRHDGML